MVPSSNDGEEKAPITVDDTHAIVRDAIADLQRLPIGTLNETELEHVGRVLQRLYDLDDALAVRSDLETADRPSEVLGEEPEREGVDGEQGWA